MISLVMGFNNSEYVGELTLVLLSIFTLQKLPAIKYDYASFIGDKIHDQFMRLENEMFSSIPPLYIISCFLIN